MINKFRFFLLIVFIFSILTVLYSSDIEVTLVVGETGYMKDNAWVPIETGDILSEDMMIKTGEQSKIVIMVNDSEYDIPGNTTIKLSEFIANTDDMTTFKKKSSLLSSLTKLFVDDTAKTPSAVLGVRAAKTPDEPMDRGMEWEDDIEDEVEPTLEEARGLFKSGEVEECLKYLNENSNELNDINKAEVNDLYGTCYFNVGNFKNSIEYLKKGTSKAKSNIFLIALSYQYLEDYKNSNSYLKKYTDTFKKDENIPEIYLLMASNYKAAGNDKSYIKTLKLIIKNYKDKPAAEVAKTELGIK